jgi:serine/threonine-protein kinase SRPK3
MFGRPLFSRRGATAADRNQLARMVALLGPPPSRLLADSGPRVLVFFNEDRSTKGEILNESLESVVASRLERVGRTMTTEESEAFLSFIRKTLTWT